MGTVAVGCGLDFGRARRGAALLADGIRRGGATGCDWRAEHAIVGRKLPGVGWHAYGQLLALKILLFLAMVCIALFNRFRLLPRFRREAQASAATAALARSVLCEQGLGLAILAVVSVLGTWPPAIHAAGDSSDGADLVITHHPVDRE